MGYPTPFETDFPCIRCKELESALAERERECERLRTDVRDSFTVGGKCKALSDPDNCECPKCRADRAEAALAEMRREYEGLRNYVGGNDFRSDFRNVDEMRSALKTAESALAEESQGRKACQVNLSTVLEQRERLRVKLKGLKKASGGFLWLGNNLHNIKADPDRFKTLFEAALADLNETLGTDKSDD